MARAMVVVPGKACSAMSAVGCITVLVGAMYLVSGSFRSNAAGMSIAVAPVLIPRDKQRGAKPGRPRRAALPRPAPDRDHSADLCLITIGSVTCVSISALFTGALPGRGNRDHPVRRWSGVATGAIARPCQPVRGGRQIAKPSSAPLPRHRSVLPFVIPLRRGRGIATATEVSTIGNRLQLVIGLLNLPPSPTATADAEAYRKTARCQKKKKRG